MSRCVPPAAVPCCLMTWYSTELWHTAGRHRRLYVADAAADRLDLQESVKEAEVAEALFDLANMFEKAETVLEGEEAGAGKGSLRVRSKQGATGAHRAAAHHQEEPPQANGRGGYGRGPRDADTRRSHVAAEADGGAAPHPAPAYDAAGHIGGGGQRNGEVLPRDVSNPWDPRNLQSLGLLPGGKANGLLGLSGFPPQLPASLAGFYPPPSPATAAAQLAAWPGVACCCVLSQSIQDRSAW